jgi:phosphoribosylanthranilate isomerase
VDFCQELRSQLPKGIEIIKVFSIQDEFDFSALKPFEEFCDYFLFDTKGKLPGGNGTTFDWTVLKNILRQSRFSQRWDRTRRIKSSTRNNKTNLPVYAIDVNSKFEIEPGLKKINDVRILCELSLQ